MRRFWTSPTTGAEVSVYRVGGHVLPEPSREPVPMVAKCPVIQMQRLRDDRAQRLARGIRRPTGGAA